ncbi:MAG: hypothetical protein V9H26_27215 [Verrucomicrobiota bacterium]
MKSATLPAIFNTPQLKDVAQEVTDTILKIMEETALVDWLFRPDRSWHIAGPTN